MSKPTKEQVYDAEIAPLMTQIIAICTEHKIANLCTFSLGDDGLLCTTALLEDGLEPPEEMLACLRILRPPRRSPLMMTVRDGDGNVKEMHAIP